MPRIILTAADGETLVGHIPDSWAEVPLSAFAQLSAARTLAERCAAVAALTSLPAAVVEADAAICLAVLQAASWLTQGPLPEAADPPDTLTHRGRCYAYVGELHRLTAGQYQTLSDFVAEAQADGDSALSVAHKLLGVLYMPVADEPPPRRWWQRRRKSAAPAAPDPQALTIEALSATAAALADLPMSVAYAAIMGFFQRGSGLVAATRMYSAVAPPVLELLNTLEQRLTDGASRPHSWNMVRWLALRWIRRVQRQLSTSSTRFNITAKASGGKLRPVQPTNTLRTWRT